MGRGLRSVAANAPWHFILLRPWVAWILGNYNLWWRSFSNVPSRSNTISIPKSTGWSGTRSACLYCFWIETRLRNKGRNVEWHLRGFLCAFEKGNECGTLFDCFFPLTHCNSIVDGLKMVGKTNWLLVASFSLYNLISIRRKFWLVITLKVCHTSLTVSDCIFLLI